MAVIIDYLKCKECDHINVCRWRDDYEKDTIEIPSKYPFLKFDIKCTEFKEKRGNIR